MKRDRTLAGQVAVVSGGAGDIGRAIARRFRAHGARVALGDVLPRAKVHSRVAGFRYTQVDFSDAAAVDAWLSCVSHDLSRRSRQPSPARF